jgi:predicted ATP-grasp superfamily ATP-dependent carboligase
MAEFYDKDRTRSLAESLGIAVAPGAVLRAEDRAENLVARFGLPVVIKPRQSFWIDRLETWGKVWIIETVEELKEQLGSLTDHARYLVEGFFPGGVGVGVSVLAKEGRILQAFQHRRLREGRGASSSYRVSEPLNPELLAACASLCRETELTGVCMFEFRCNPRDGSWILLETNARFWGSLPLPLSLGLDFPRYLHDLLVFGAEPEQVSYAQGVRSRNLVLDAHNLLSRARELPAAGPRFVADIADFLLQPLRWATGRERSDSFVADDPRPGFSELKSLAHGVRERWSGRRRDEGGPELRDGAGSRGLPEKLPRAA